MTDEAILEPPKVGQCSFLKLPREILTQILRYLLKSGDPVGKEFIKTCGNPVHVECTCSIVELSSQVLRTNKTLLELGLPILYKENMLHMSVKPNLLRGQVCEMMDFHIGGIIVPVMADARHAPQPGNFAEDFYQAGCRFASDPSTHPWSKSCVNMLMNHWSFINRIKTLHLTLTYCQLSDVYVVFRSLRRNIKNKDVVLEPKCQPDPLYRRDLGNFTHRSWEGCQIARCRSFTVKHEPDLVSSPTASDSATALTHSAWLGFSELASIMTSPEPAEDLWRMWVNTYDIVLYDVPRGLEETGLLDEFRYLPEMWEAIWRGQRSAVLKAQRSTLRNYRRMLADWYKDADADIEARLDALGGTS